MATKTDSPATIGAPRMRCFGRPDLGPDKPPGTVGPLCFLTPEALYCAAGQWQVIPRYGLDRRYMAGFASGLQEYSSELGRRCCTTMIDKWLSTSNGKPSMG